MGGGGIGGWGCVDKRGAICLCGCTKHPVIPCLLITTETNRQTDTSATCISPGEMSGGPHVPFEGLLIGPNKDR